MKNYFLYIILLASLLFNNNCHNSLVYRPSKKIFLDPSVFQYSPKDIYFRSHDGLRLHAWHFPSRKRKTLGTILHFHGNAQNISTHFISLAWLTHHGFDLISFDYRGYGKSQGVPDAAFIHLDTIQILNQVHNEMQKKESKLIIYAQSLGAAIALRTIPEMHSRSNLAAVYVEGSFSSYRSVALEKSGNFCFFPFTHALSYAVSDEFSPQNQIKQIAPTPLIVYHGENDLIIPLKFGKQVFALARDPRNLIIIPDGGHLNWLSQNAASYRKRFTKDLLDRVKKFIIGDHN